MKYPFGPLAEGDRRIRGDKTALSCPSLRAARDEATGSNLFFIPLEKPEREDSPSTLYKDYAISPELVHWESQSTTSQVSATGQRYIHHARNGESILLFVRQRRLAE